MSKGQKIDLTKSHPGLKKIIVGLGWNTNQSGGGKNFDLDASAFLLSANGKVENEKDFVFYNNPSGAQGSVVHSGDARRGGADGDNERIYIDLNLVPEHIARIAFSITIFDAVARRQNFGQVSGAYVRILNADTEDVLLYYDLGQDFSVETAIVAAELYRHKGEWKFNAVGSGFQGGLAALCRNFGLEVEDEQPTAPIPPYSVGGHVAASSSYPSTSFGAPLGTPQSNGVPGAAGALSEPGPESGLRCPRCQSTRITAGKKGFGIGKAIVGGLLLGPVGLLGGFIGSKKIEFACLSCQQRWTPEENRDYARWLDEQKSKAQDIINRYKGQDMLDAIVAGCALVSLADGVVEDSEREQMLNYFRSSEELRVFDTNQVVSRFNHYVQQIQNNQMMGRVEVLRAIGKMRNKPEAARLLARLCCAIGFADGQFDANEKRVVTEICRELDLNPAEFIN